MIYCVFFVTSDVFSDRSGVRPSKSFKPLGIENDDTPGVAAAGMRKMP
jgi:hypothetical protein